jgi:hypothetical protein
MTTAIAKTSRTCVRTPCFKGVAETVERSAGDDTA